MAGGRSTGIATGALEQAETGHALPMPHAPLSEGTRIFTPATQGGQPDLVAKHVAKMSLLFALDAAAFKLITLGFSGLGGGGVFLQGPWAAGVAGAALFGGLVLGLAANVAAIIETWQFAVALYLLATEEIG